MVLFVIELQEQVNVLAAGIEGPVVSENALQGSLSGRDSDPVREKDGHEASEKRGM